MTPFEIRIVPTDVIAVLPGGAAARRWLGTMPDGGVLDVWVALIGVPPGVDDSLLSATLIALQGSASSGPCELRAMRPRGPSSN